MKGNILITSIALLAVAGIISGFKVLSDNPDKKDSPYSQKTSPVNFDDLVKQNSAPTDNAGSQNSVSGVPYYTDNFEGSNDSAGLTARGYKVYRNGGPAGITFWFTGNQAIFPAFNGTPTSYAGSNYNATTGANRIDNWLVLPKKSVATGDAIVFRCRSVSPNSFPDSIKVMYSAVGDSTPSAGSWVQLGYFRAVSDGTWELKTFNAPSPGANARWAIRHFIINGGPNGLNSNYIGIDALTLEAPAGVNDIAATSINAPGNVFLPTPAIAPKATFSNVGSAGQSNIPVTFKITGPVNYTSNKIIPSLGAGASTLVTFDNTFNPTAGTYNLTVYAGLGSDGNRSNDTLKATINVVNPNFGGGGAGTGNYYFANSTPNGSLAPSSPQFKRIDTAGSISLALNNSAVTPLRKGNLDDGSWALVNPGGTKKVKFMGVLHDSIFIGTNGIIAFTNFEPGSTSNWNPPGGGLPAPGAGSPPVRPAIYPLWNDLDWSETNVPVNRLSYRVDNANSFLLITYDKAPLFGANSAAENLSMQICLELQETSVIPSSNITIYYSSASYVTVPYLAGLQDDSGMNYLQYRYFDGMNLISAGPIYQEGADGVAVAYGPDPNELKGCCKSLFLTFNLQSCPVPGAATVLLRRGSSPYAIVDSSKGIGGGDIGRTFDFANVSNSVPYYVVVKTINSIETWSATTISFSGINHSYDFTASISQAYGNNQVLSGGIPSIYQGDSNQDGIVDLTDLALVFNFANSFSGSPQTDFNCDGITDLTDIVLCFNNSKDFIQVRRP
jgi:hypothetical protein